jgi:hypothetical protein
MASEARGTTASDVPITDEMIDELAAKAKAGYDVEETLRRRGGRPPIGLATASGESGRLKPSCARHWSSAPKHDHERVRPVIHKHCANTSRSPSPQPYRRISIPEATNAGSTPVAPAFGTTLRLVVFVTLLGRLEVGQVVVVWLDGDDLAEPRCVEDEHDVELALCGVSQAPRLCCEHQSSRAVLCATAVFPPASVTVEEIWTSSLSPARISRLSIRSEAPV